MRRALLLAVAVAVLAGAAPAGAQGPIAGGGSFNDAPVLKPGRYTDTLRGGEQLFYAVELKPGQQLTAGATVKGRTDSSYSLVLQIYNPVRAEDVFDGEQTASYGQRDRSVSLRVEGQRVGEDDGGTSDALYAEPGSYYVSLAADDRGNNLEAEQFDTSIDLQVTGEVIPDPTPTATAEPAQTAEPAAGGLGNGGGGGAGGGGELGMAIVLGLALGGLVGFGVRRLRTTG
jgi:Ca-activated chloride channel homolog